MDNETASAPNQLMSRPSRRFQKEMTTDQIHFFTSILKTETRSLGVPVAWEKNKNGRDAAAHRSRLQSSRLMSFWCALPVASRSRVSGLAAVAQQLPSFTQEAGGAETVAIKTLLLLLSSLKWRVNPVALSQHGEGEQGEEEEKRTQAG